MSRIKIINIKEYDYDLPEKRIAQYPVKERDKSNLLIYRNGRISKDIFMNIDEYLPDKTLLIFNNTKVIRARLLFEKGSGAGIEVFCLEPLTPPDYRQSFGSAASVEWKCMIGNLKKWKSGKLTLNFLHNGISHALTAQKIKSEADGCRVAFTWSPPELTFGEILGLAGHIPLPPYVKREDEKEDNIRYQTVYSKINGSVAAPTAGLHFTEKVLEKIRNRGIESAEITLHVGAGTFQPVRTDDIRKHEMHNEHFFVNREVIDKILSFTGNIIAAGTTSVRALESLYWLGVNQIRRPYKAGTELSVGQWEPYDDAGDIPLKDSMMALLGMLDRRDLKSFHASTRIMIIPGYKFRVIDGMITNFHQPGSTLLLLVSAWTGEQWEKIYSYALGNGFRFLSFGDSSLLLK